LCAQGEGRSTVINSQSGALGAAAVQIGYFLKLAVWDEDYLDCGSGVRFRRSYRFHFGLHVVWRRYMALLVS